MEATDTATYRNAGPATACERCGDAPIYGFACTGISIELHTENFSATEAILCATCAAEAPIGPDAAFLIASN